jgi:hypothetical protein
MNILEAYLKNFNQIIILIFGLPCTNKSEIAKELGSDLKLEIIKINDFLIKDKYKEVEIDEFKIKIYEHTDNYDWDKLNLKINDAKKKGVIIYGNYLDIDKINWKIDFAFFYFMNVKNCQEILLEKKMVDDNLSKKALSKYFSKYLNILYDELKKKIKINKFFKINNKITFVNSYDLIFDTLMELILQSLNEKFKSK